MITLTTGATAPENVGYAYDNAGRLSSTVANGRTTGYQYDAAGNRTRMTWPDAFYVSTDYDALNRTTVLKENGSTALVTYAYDDLSRRTTVTRGNGTSSSFGYDTQSNLSALSHDLAGTAQDVAYTYTRNQAGEIATHSWSNDLYRWAGVTGNATNGTRSYTANGLNQYTAAAGATVSHDSNGNITGEGTWTFTYDQNNRLRTAVKSGTSMTLTYDAEGRLRQQLIGSTQGYKLYDGHDLVAEYDNPTTSFVRRRWVHGPGLDEPVVYYQHPSSTSTIKAWLIADHQGSVLAEVNTAGAHLNSGTYIANYSYGPYGEPNINEGRFRYTGQQRLDSSELHYYKARIYHPKLGRFLQTDPIGTADDMNLYGYVGNDPVNATDPTGQLVMQVGAGIVGGVGGVLFQAGADLLSGKLSSFGNYAGAFVGGAAGGAAAVTCGPACAGIVAGAASSVAQQLIDTRSVNFGSVALDAGLGAVGGAVAGRMVPALSKPYLSSATKGSIGEGLSEIGIRATGGQIAKRDAATGFGKSNLDFRMSNGTSVESKFGTSVPKGPQKAAINSGQFPGYMGEGLVHAWSYPTVSGIATSPFASAAAGK